MTSKRGRLFAAPAVVVGLATFSMAQAPRDQAPAAKNQELPKKKGELAKKKAFVPPLEGVQVVKDLTYARIGPERELKLDLYLPEKAEGKLPLIVWIHGGGWRGGSKEGTPAAGLAQHGYVVASVAYRLSGEARFPAQIQDCKAAIRWLRAHAEPYHIDPDRIGAWGSSAGGHLVALLGTAGDEKPWDVGAHTDQSSRVQAVCDFYGPADLNDMPDAQAIRPSGAVALLLGGPVSENRDAARAASPLTYVSKESPPFLICHGTEDPVVPITQSEKLAQALTAAGVKVTLVRVQNAAHGFGGENIDPPVRAIQEQVRAFFDEHLKN